MICWQWPNETFDLLSEKTNGIVIYSSLTSKYWLKEKAAYILRILSRYLWERCGHCVRLILCQHPMIFYCFVLLKRIPQQWCTSLLLSLFWILPQHCMYIIKSPLHTNMYIQWALPLDNKILGQTVILYAHLHILVGIHKEKSTYFWVFNAVHKYANSWSIFVESQYCRLIYWLSIVICPILRAILSSSAQE